MGLWFRPRTVFIGCLVFVVGALGDQIASSSRSWGDVVGVAATAAVIYSGLALLVWTINNPNEFARRVAVTTLIIGLACTAFALAGLLANSVNIRLFCWVGVVGGGFLSFSALLRSRLTQMAHVDQRTPAQQQQDIVDVVNDIRKP